MFTGPPGFAPHPSALVNNGLLDSARVSMLKNDNSPEAILARRYFWHFSYSFILMFKSSSSY